MLIFLIGYFTYYSCILNVSNICFSLNIDRFYDYCQITTISKQMPTVHIIILIQNFGKCIELLEINDYCS